MDITKLLIRELIYKLIIIVAIGSGFFFSISFGTFGGFKVAVITLANLSIFVLSIYLLYNRPLIYVLCVVIVVMYMLIGISNQRIISYGIALLSNLYLVVLFYKRYVDIDFLTAVGRVYLWVGFIIFIGYLLEVEMYGATVASDPTQWGPSRYLFRYTMGRMFSFQGFSGNPNMALFPYLVSFFLAYRWNIKSFEAFLFTLLIIVIALSTNSRGNMLMLVLFLLYVVIKNMKYILYISIPLGSLIYVYITSHLIFVFDIYQNLLRKANAGFYSRFDKWDSAYSIFQDNILFGGGVRVVRSTIGMGAENGYLEILASFGIFGMIISLGSIAYILHIALRKGDGRFLLIFMFLFIALFNTSFVYPVAMICLGLSISTWDAPQKNCSVGIYKQNLCV
jgi:hypothetical protein